MPVGKNLDLYGNFFFTKLGNYLFGLTGDDHDSMQKTFDLSVELNTLGWNAYAVMPLPGSQIFKKAKENNEIIEYIKNRYVQAKLRGVQTKVDDSGNTWLNLDWFASTIGGKYTDFDYGTTFYLLQNFCEN